MYRLIWKYVNKLGMKQNHRRYFYLFLCTLVFAFAGAAVWFVFLKDLLGDSVKWMICVIGFPSVIFGFLCGVFALFKIDQ